MSIKRLFFKDTIIYGFTSYLALAASFFLTPLYTRILSKTDYGTMDLFSTWNNFFTSIIPLGLTAAILRLYMDFKDDEALKKRYLGTLFVTIVGTCTIYAVLMIALTSQVKEFYYKEGFVYSLFYMSLIIIPLQAFTEYFQSLNRVEFRKYRYLIINVTQFILLSGLGFSLVYVYRLGIIGFFIAALVASVVSFLIAFQSAYREIYINFDFSIFKSAISYSYALLIVIIFLRFTYIVDRFLINSFLSVQDVGEYSIAVRVGNVMDLVVGGFITAWFPYAMSLINNEDRLPIYQKVFKYYLIIFTLAAFLMNLFVRELLIFIAPSYLAVEPIAYIIVSNAVIVGTAYFFGLGIHIAKKSHFFILSTLISFIVNVGCSYILLQYLGLFGIVIGSSLAILSWTMTEYFISYKLEKIVFDLKQMFLAIIFLILTSVAIYYFNKLEISIIIQIAIKILVAIMAVIILMILEKEQVAVLFKQVKERFRSKE